MTSTFHTAGFHAARFQPARFQPGDFQPARFRPSVRTRVATTVAAGLLFLASLAMTTPASAQQRNPLQTIGQTVADHASHAYAFERFTVASHDGSRTWRVHVAVPKTPAPAAGWPTFWMLDGNAALIEFDDALLEELAAQPEPHALVFIGYDNDLRIDSPQRNRDYTPAVLPPEDAETAPLGSGGADALAELIERTIRPQLAQRMPIDPQRQTLWGHSLGGLFVLHTLYTRTGAFQTYVAGSPSMWWGDAHAVRESERFIAHNVGHPARVIIHLGGAERVGDRGRRDLTNPRVVAHLRRIQAATPDAAMQLAGTLATVPGIEASYREFPGLGHGPMFRASLMGALHAVTGVADRSNTPRPSTGDADQ
ncbi:alpha/beta hydrolase [Luteimonas yindakuii]|nr:alpha/beta hydrolase [Luteimonas yindakuii]